MSYHFVDEEAGIQEYQYSNGLKTLLVENSSAPVVTVLVVYKVGSRNEGVGYTGATHFLEHMLFKGTPEFNKSKGSLIAQVLSKEGASFNATTWLDRTTYFETLSADKLELALQIESDRMQHAFVRDKDRQSEMSVVRNEMERDENEPDSIMFKNLFAQSFLAHPYHHPTIGWHSDVEGMPTSRLKKFYKEFYHPNNATLVIVGDIDREQTLKWVDQYFGVIPESKKPIPKMYTEEFPQQGERRFTIKRPGQLGIVQMGFHVPAQSHPDSYALDFLQGVLSEGISSRLHQALVEPHLCLYAGAYNLQLKDPGLFVISTKMASNVKHKQVEKAVMKEINRLKRTPPTAKEMERILNLTRAAFSYQRHGTTQLASLLGEYEATTDWKYMVNYLDNLEKVTAKDIQRVAKTYLLADNLTVGYFVPEKAKTVTLNGAETAEAPLEVKNKKPSKSKASKSASQLKRQVLDNGAILLTRENPLDHTIAIQGKIRAGTIFEKKKLPGLVTLTAGMLKKGTRNYNKIELSDTLASIGSYFSFNVGLDHISFSIRCLSENLSQTLELVKEVFCEPVFPQDEFDKLKLKRVDQLKHRLDNTDAMAYDAVYRELFPEDHPHYQPKMDELIEATEKMTLANVKSFYKSHFSSKEMIISAVGDFKTKELKTFWSQTFWKAKGKALPEVAEIACATQESYAVHSMPDKANVSTVMGHATGLTRNHPDYFAALLANHALGQSALASRLGLKIRDEMGLTYGIYSYFTDIGRGSGPWLVSVTTNPENVDLTIQAIKKEVQKYVDEGMTLKEFEDAKSSMIGSYLVNLSTNPEIAFRMLQLEEYQLGLDYFTERAKILGKVTHEAANQAIKTYFKPSVFTYGIAGKYIADKEPKS